MSFLTVLDRGRCSRVSDAGNSSRVFAVDSGSRFVAISGHRTSASDKCRR